MAGASAAEQPHEDWMRGLGPQSPSGVSHGTETWVEAEGEAVDSLEPGVLWLAEGVSADSEPDMVRRDAVRRWTLMEVPYLWWCAGEAGLCLPQLTYLWFRALTEESGIRFAWWCVYVGSIALLVALRTIIVAMHERHDPQTGWGPLEIKLARSQTFSLVGLHSLMLLHMTVESIVEGKFEWVTAVKVLAVFTMMYCNAAFYVWQVLCGGAVLRRRQRRYPSSSSPSAAGRCAPVEPALEVGSPRLFGSMDVGEAPACSSLACAVCLEDYVASDLVVTLPCSHLFHGRCIESWVRTGKACPFRCAPPAPPGHAERPALEEV